MLISRYYIFKKYQNQIIRACWKVNTENNFFFIPSSKFYNR